MSMKTSKTPMRRICCFVCAVILAVGMSWPCGMALADGDEKDAAPTGETASGSNEDGSTPESPEPAPDPAPVEPTPEPTPEPTLDPAASDTSDEPTSDTSASDDSSSDSSKPAPSEQEGRDNEQILKAAREAGLSGVDALEKWLNGVSLTDEEIVTIDLEGLAGIDADLANEIRPAQEEAKERLAAAKEKESAEGEKDKDSSKKADGEDKKKDDDSDDSSYPAWTYKGDTSMPPTFHGPNLETAKFIAVFGEPSRKLASENDLYASVMIAQAIMESEAGGSALAQSPNFNLFGMEGAYKGESVSIDTQEGDAEGKGGTESVEFKKYPTYEASLEDYVDLLSGANYKSAHKSTTESYVDACEYLEGTYSDSTQYSETLQSLISSYELTRYDEPLGYEVTDNSDVDLSSLVIQAADNLGKPYVWGATGPSGFDCSGLVVSTYSSALEMQLPRTTYFQCLTGEDVDFADLHMGDLLFFTNSKNEANHVAMYIGEGCYIESTTPGGVQVTALSEHMPAFAKRMVPTHAV